MTDKTTKTDSQKIAEANKNIDGWNNVYTGEGVNGVAKSSGFKYVRDLKMTETMSRNIYQSDGFGAKVIDRPVGDMVRAWFDVVGDTDGAITSYLRKLDTKKKVKAALTWSKVYGGSVIVMGLDDGGTFEDPLNEDALKGVDFLQVYDRHRITWTTADLYSDKEEPKFGEIEFYQINPNTSPATPFRVHESRILRFEGPLSDQYTRQQNNGWNESFYRKVLTQLINVNSSLAGAKDVIDDFITTILKIQGLQGMIAAGQDDLIKDRLNIIDLGKRSMNTIMIDDNENYEKNASSVAGLGKLLEEFQQALAAVADIPMTVLMGRSPGGLNATGDADIRLYYDRIAEAQEDDLYGPLSRLVYLSMKSTEGPTKGNIEEGWAVEFNPLWQPTEKETVETRKIQAETDVNYIREGVLTNDEVAASRFGGDEYSIETTIDLENRPEEEPDDPEKKPVNDRKPAKYKKSPRHNHDFIENLFEGTTDEKLGHKHKFFIYDKTTGNGWTEAAGDDNHIHRIEGGTVQYYEVNNVTHLHTIPAIPGFGE